MDPFVCVTCHDKNCSEYSDQIDRIYSVLRNAGYGTGKTDIDESKDAFEFISAMTISTYDKCKYGLYCPTLSQNKVKVDHKIQKMAGSVIAYLNTLDFNSLQEFLRYFQGYFPAGYKWIENYWRRCVNKY